ncbi:MAG: ATP-grasp domain-containing protein [Lachnospiraceae bacterium]|nr:ATP-grasp domain-containing protein [Lachnospiraceae bacterium]
MRRVLVTAISGDLANGILRILGENHITAYGTDIYDYPVGMDKVIEWKKICPARDPGYTGVLLGLCRMWEITHIIPGNESELKVLSDNRDEFEALGIRLIINSPKIIDTFLDKYETARALSEIGISVPDTYLYDGFVPDGRQYIAKLRSSCGSKFLELVKSKDDISCPEGAGDVIIQEYIDAEDEEYTVGVFSDGDAVSTVIFNRTLKHGYTDFVELCTDDAMTDAAEKIARHFGLRGYLNVQLRKKNGVPTVFEINPRISGSVGFRHLAGFDDVLWWLDLADGITPERYAGRYKKMTAMKELVEKIIIRE